MQICIHLHTYIHHIILLYVSLYLYLKAFSMGCLCICKISYLLRSHILLFFNMQRIRHAHGLIHHQSLSCSLDVFMWRFETSDIYAILQLIKIYQPAIMTAASDITLLSCLCYRYKRIYESDGLQASSSRSHIFLSSPTRSTF